MNDNQLDNHHGSCLCGIVRYSLSKESFGVVVCMCKICQQMTGSDYNSLNQLSEWPNLNLIKVSLESMNTFLKEAGMRFLYIFVVIVELHYFIILSACFLSKGHRFQVSQSRRKAVQNGYSDRSLELL